MKTELSISFLILLLVATPAMAANGKGNGKGQEVRSEKAEKVKFPEAGESDITTSSTDTSIIAPSVTGTPGVGQTQTCDQNAEWKNHGQYVSCVAKTNPGGQVVSAAARSNIGKKKTLGTTSPTPSVSPSITVTPTESVSPTPTSTPSATPTEDPTLTPTITPDDITVTFNPLESIKSFFKRISDLFNSAS